MLKLRPSITYDTHWPEIREESIITPGSWYVDSLTVYVCGFRKSKTTVTYNSLGGRTEVTHTLFRAYREWTCGPKVTTMIRDAICKSLTRLKYTACLALPLSYSETE